jgi:(p)ppGpp synthase/HD superfamily hydrolase
VKTEKHRSILNYISSKVKNKDEVIHAWSVAEKTKEFSLDDRIYIVALLHDVVEDGYTTFKKLQKLYDLDDEQMAALDAITRREGEKYFDYIERVKQNEMAKTVKLADLQHNIDRCANDLPNRWGLLRRYAKAYGILIGEAKEQSK